ncbi:hypothetical protein [Paludisphaera mucosa]|uniref:Myb-like domain-containing protein n=1 Tax=Paludisphaera mucosa TaxID=3030827 RepID=A0ABT6FFY5_9BACT|nr:hypothetical protein [Paludisphaera mucosa]MDG3006437.1 hypothetical protein [Paludisphaera mucosa]
MTLERVFFKKGREHKPRLSAPRVPGHRDERYWTDEENQILSEHYPTKVLSCCANLLPARTKSAIYGQVGKLGLKRSGQQQKKSRSREEFAALDAKITEMWPTLKVPKGDLSGVKELARQLDEPRWVVSDRCTRLGLTRPRKKEPKWTAAEDELMKRVPLHDPDKCSEIFRAHGFTRTATAIMVRAKRINLSRRNTETFSARSAALVLGLDNKTVSEYCLKGIIKSSRRGTKRLPQQGGDAHSIERADLRQFVIEHLELIDFRKVDKFALVDLLVSVQNGRLE